MPGVRQINVAHVARPGLAVVEVTAADDETAFAVQALPSSLVSISRCAGMGGAWPGVVPPGRRSGRRARAGPAQDAETTDHCRSGEARAQQSEGRCSIRRQIRRRVLYPITGEDPGRLLRVVRDEHRLITVGIGIHPGVVREHDLFSGPRAAYQAHLDVLGLGVDAYDGGSGSDAPGAQVLCQGVGREPEDGSHTEAQQRHTEPCKDHAALWRLRTRLPPCCPAGRLACPFHVRWQLIPVGRAPVLLLSHS